MTDLWTTLQKTEFALTSLTLRCHKFSVDKLGLTVLAQATHMLVQLKLSKLRKLAFVLSQEQLPFEDGDGPHEPNVTISVSVPIDDIGALEVVCVELHLPSPESVRPRCHPPKDIQEEVVRALRGVLGGEDTVVNVEILRGK